jgi:hypothetical protein
MSNISSELATIANGKINFNFESFESIGNYTNTRVLYAQMMQDEHYVKLSEIIHVIIKTLLDENILDLKRLNDLHIEYDQVNMKYRIKLHMTLLNILFHNKILKKQNKKEVRNIDATEILEYMNNKSLPSAEITKVNFSRMREDKKTQKYELLYSYSLIK